MINLMLVHEGELMKSQSIFKRDFETIMNCLDTLKKSILNGYPDQHQLYHNYDYETLELCKQKALSDLGQMTVNFNKSEFLNDWLDTLYIYYFECKVHLLLPQLWFVPKRLVVDALLIQEIKRFIPYLGEDIDSYDMLPEYNALSDGNFNYFELSQYNLDTKAITSEPYSKLSLVLSWIKMFNQEPEMKLILEVFSSSE